MSTKLWWLTVCWCGLP